MTEAITSLKELGEQIEELVGQSIADLPQPDHFAWWHPEHKKYITFKRGEPHPWMPKLIVTAMFRDAEEIRVYTLPGAEPDEKVWGIRRYFLSKKDGGSYEVENIPVAAFAQMIADEWVLVAESVRSAEREKNQIVAFLEALDDDVKASDAAAAITENAHWLETPEPAAPPAVNGVSVTPPPPDPLPS